MLASYIKPNAEFEDGKYMKLNAYAFLGVDIQQELTLKSSVY